MEINLTINNSNVTVTQNELDIVLIVEQGETTVTIPLSRLDLRNLANILNAAVTHRDC